MYRYGMALVIPQGYAHVVHSLQLTGDPDPFAVTYGVDCVVGSTPAGIATELDGFFDTLMGQMSNQITLINTDVRFQEDPPPAPPVVGSKANSQAGAGTGAILPQNCAYLVHKRTATGGRGGRGRMYLPGVDEAQASNIGAINLANVAGLVNSLNTLLTSINSGVTVAQMVILHDSNGVHAADPPRVVTSLTLDPVIATQRRRLRR